jgi:hypothetical protein
VLRRNSAVAQSGAPLGEQCGSGLADLHRAGAATGAGRGPLHRRQHGQQPVDHYLYATRYRFATATATTVQYIALCGSGDKGREEDYVQVLAPATITIPAHTSSVKVLLRQFAYVGANAGETYVEGWFMDLMNPSAGVLGRSVGEGVLLPDLENAKTKIVDLYAGGAGPVPTPGSNEPMYLTVTLGAPLSSAVTIYTASGTGTVLSS